MGLARIKQGDRVLVQVGKFKGRVGEVQSFGRDGAYVHVSGCTRIKHVRPNPDRNIEGGRVQVPMPIHASNVALVDGNDAPIKVGVKVLEDGKKVRVNRKTHEVVDN